MTKQWNKLPIGTALIDDHHGRWVIVPQQPACGVYLGDAWLWGRSERETPGSFDLIWAVSEIEQDSRNLRLDPAEFADAYKRDELAKLGFFSIDDPAKVERTRCEREALAEREAAFRRAGLDRDVILDRLSAFLENRTDGIWATSTLDYAQRRRKLDEAFLAAFGSNQ